MYPSSAIKHGNKRQIIFAPTTVVDLFVPIIVVQQQQNTTQWQKPFLPSIISEPKVQQRDNNIISQDKILLIGTISTRAVIAHF